MRNPFLIARAFLALLALMLGACGGNPPKPVLPDGLHRVPVNRVPAVPSASKARAASSTDGAGL